MKSTADNLGGESAKYWKPKSDSMLQPRNPIPVLQLMGKLAVKTTKFENPAVIEKWVDMGAPEIMITDITHSMNIELLRQLARISQVPVSYGGGVMTLEDMRNALQTGCHKVILCSCAHPDLIAAIVDEVGPQGVSVCIDHDETGMTYIDGGNLPVGIDVINRAKEAQAAGAEEIILHSRTGMEHLAA
jgi:cyclase